MSSSILSLVLYTILGAVTALGLTAGDLTQSGAELTTRRVADAIQYRSGCHAAEDITRLVQTKSDDIFYELWNKFRREGKCFRMPRPAAAVLKKWLSGPYILPDLRTVSIWRIRDQFDDVEFVILHDLGGPHEAQRDAS